MKSPICSICMKSDILCPACGEKVSSGLVRKEDLASLRRIESLASRIKPLQDITIRRLISTREYMIIVCGRGDASKLIGRGGTIIKSLTSALGRNVRVIEETSDIKTFLEMLVYPVPVNSIGKVFRDSGEVTRMRVPRSQRLPVSHEAIRDAAMLLFDQKVEVVSE